MEHHFWHQRWEHGQIGFHQPHYNTYLQRFWETLGLAAGSRVFVPLCGKSLDMLWLRERGHQVLGVEISPLAVRDFHGENALDARIEDRGPFQCWQGDGLTLLCGDFFDLQAEDLKGCAGIYDRASLVAFPAGSRLRYARHLGAIAPRDAVMLLVTMEYPQHEMQGPPFSVPEQEVRTLFGEDCTITRMLSAEVLDDYPRFRDKGLSRLTEKVFRLERGNRPRT